MLSRSLFALCFSGTLFLGAWNCAAKQPSEARESFYFATNEAPSVSPVKSTHQEALLQPNGATSVLVSVAPLAPARSVSTLYQDFVAASEKSRAAQRRLEAGRGEEAVRLFAESLAELIGVQRSSPDFAPDAVSQKIREVRLDLEKSLEP